MASNKKKPAASNEPEIRTPTTQELREEKFARQYVLHHNGARAYIEAGYGPKDIVVAASAASRMLRKVSVKRRVGALEFEASQRLEITKDKLERAIASVAFIDLRDFYDDNGAMIPIKQWTREMAAAVKEIEVDEIWSGTGDARTLAGYTRKLKLWDKPAYAALLGASHGIGIKRVEVGTPGEFERLTSVQREKSIRERAARLGMNVVPLLTKRAGGS